MTKVNSLEIQALAVGRLRALPLFADLGDADLELLAQQATQCRLESDEYLFQEGAPAHGYYLVLEGGVEVLRFGLDGEDRIFNVFGPGQLVAIAAMFMRHGRYPMNARARASSVCLRLQRAPLNHVCAHTPALALRLLSMMSDSLYRHVNEVEWLTTSTAAQRLALYLLRLGARQSGVLLLPLSQRQLAAHLGVRPETLSRLLADWQSRGVVAGRGREWRVADRCYLQGLTQAADRSF